MSIAATSEHSAHDVAAIGDAYLTAGDLETAISHYTRALESSPTLMHAQINLGIAHFHRGDPATALHALQSATELEPTSLEAWANLGAVHLHLGDVERAVQDFETALVLGPNHADIHSNLGASYSAVGRNSKARHHLQRAVALSPHTASVHVNLGNSLTKQGDHGAATKAFEMATSLEPGNADAWCNLSVCLKEAGCYVDAAASAWTAHCLKPDEARPCVALGTALLNLPGGPPHSGIAKATKDLVQMAGLSEDLDARYRDALAWLLAAYDQNPSDTDTIRNIASAYDQAGDLDEARNWFQHILSLRPDDSFSLSRLVDITLALCDWQSYDIFKNRLLAQVARQLKDGDEISIDVINLIALPTSNDFTFQVSRRKATQISERLRETGPQFQLMSASRSHDKIRLGYLLPYTRFTSMTQALAEIVSRHDRDRFDVFGYCVDKAGMGSFEQSFRQSFDRFRDIPRAVPKRGAEIIRNDGIDILVDTTGHTTISCLPVMAMRPAPVQAHFLGYGLTTGADYVDYLITDRTFTPPHLAAYCSEKLVYLPYSFLPANRVPIDGATITRTDCGLPDDGLVFCNFNQPAKFEPVAFSLWMRILKSVPGSVLWLGDWNRATRENLRREAEARDVAMDRLVFAEILPHAQHLRRLQLADLALDTLFHGGGMTSTDVLWAGVPLLTCAGETPQSRLGASLLAALGLPELIAEGRDEFTGLAIDLSRNPDHLNELRQKLHDCRLNSPVFDQNRYVRDLERSYEMMSATANKELPSFNFRSRHNVRHLS